MCLIKYLKTNNYILDSTISKSSIKIYAEDIYKRLFMSCFSDAEESSSDGDITEIQADDTFKTKI